MTQHHKTPENNVRRQRRFDLWGWSLFIVGVVFFILSSAKNRDMLGLAGSIIFLVGCTVFIYPMLFSKKPKGDTKDQD